MLNRLRELLLWVGAALGLLAVVAGLAVAFGGFNFLVFRSGSMSPEIPTGGLALSRTVQAADIEPGDVVSVVASNGERVTHRVVSTTLRGDEASLVLKGDANTTEDSEVYRVTEADRVVTSVPYGGYVVAHVLTPPGLLAVACFSLMLLVAGSGRDRDEDDETGADGDRGDLVGAGPRPRGGRHAAGRRSAVGRVAAGAAVVAVGATAVTGAHGTWATFTDRPTATSSASAGTLAAPTAVGCRMGGLLGLFYQVSWTAPTGPAVDGYVVHWKVGTTTGTSTTAASMTSWQPTLGMASGTYTVQVSATRGSWSSTLSTTSAQITYSGLAGVTCPTTIRGGGSTS